METITETLKCPMCLDYANNAVETDCCGQYYCKKCLDDYMQQDEEDEKAEAQTEAEADEDLYIRSMRECPSCQTEHVTYEDAYAIRRLTENLPQKCLNNCGETTTRSEMTAHLNICRKRKYDCTVADCDVKAIEEKEFIEHLSTAHKRRLLDSAPKWLPIVEEPRRYACPAPGCDFIGRVTEYGHFGKDHAEHLKYAENMFPIVHRTAPVLRNSEGRPITMAHNGKFYCGVEILVTTKKGTNIVKRCTADYKLNCSSCMRVDCCFRNLPYGSLVNGYGQVVAAKICTHTSNHRGNFHRLVKTKNVICAPASCGNLPSFNDPYIDGYFSSYEYEQVWK